MTSLQGKIAAVTGAGSGLGRALALALARRGARLAISDVDARGLAETAAQLEAASTRVSQHVVDVRDAVAVHRWADEVVAAHGAVDLLFNNAGTAAKALIECLRYEDIAFVLDVNVWGVVHGTKAFLPYLRARPEAHIVNIGSVNAFVPFPESAAYNMSKYAVLAWSETLTQELRGSNVRVTCIHPGAVKTNIVRNSRGFTDYDKSYFDRVAKMEPERAAERALRAVERNREQVTIGPDARLLSLLKRLAPRWVVRLIGKEMMSEEAKQMLAAPETLIAQAPRLAPQAAPSALVE
jgi:short-subunit dehydrogenase